MIDDRVSASRTIHQLQVGVVGAGPYAITVGPDDALWITLVPAGQIGPDGALRVAFEAGAVARIGTAHA